MLTIKQIDFLIKRHDLPMAYKDRIVAAMKAAYQIGRDSDCMKSKHKEPAK